MKVIICGAGQVGFGIAEQLAAEGNDVSVVDINPALVQRANDVLEVRATLGNGAHPDVLERAGASEADMLIAVTQADEVNMVACQVAHTLFDIPTKIARVRAQSYLSKNYSVLFSRNCLAVDLAISPEIEVGNTVLQTARCWPSASPAEMSVRLSRPLFASLLNCSLIFRRLSWLSYGRGSCSSLTTTSSSRPAMTFTW
jgi:Trk K+ transport system NAD-binding subunit